MKLINPHLIISSAFVVSDDEAQQEIWKKTSEYLTEYAKLGLRTLCMAKRVSLHPSVNLHFFYLSLCCTLFN